MPANPPDFNANPNDVRNYLDTIADKDKSSASWFSVGPLKNLSRKTLMIIGGAIGALLIGVIIFAIAAGNTRRTPATDPGAVANGLGNLEALIQYQQDNAQYIKNNQLVNVMAEAKLVIASRVNDLQAVYGNSFTVNADQSAPSLADTMTSLNNAKASSALDGAFVSAFSDQIKSTQNAIQTLYNATHDDRARTALQNTFNDLDALLSRLPTQSAAAASDTQ